MNEEQEQYDAQQLANLMAGELVEASVHIGLDVDGGHFTEPMVRLTVLGSRVILNVVDRMLPDQWLQVNISEELFRLIGEAQYDAGMMESDGDEEEEAAPPTDVFDVAWDLAASKGRCDERGGMEYQRVRAAWDRMYGEAVALDFIVTKANEQPPAPPA